MRIIIDRATSGAEGVWTANVDPQQLVKLAAPVRQGGSLSVVLVSHPNYKQEANSLEFDLGAAVLLNLGSGSKAVFVDSRESSAVTNISQVNVMPQRLHQGDEYFLQQLGCLPESTRELGRQLLAAIRTTFPGELRYHPTSKKFVESPNNFWVVRIQPRDKSLRIVIYGAPEAHLPYSTLKLVEDMKSYSAFKLQSNDQLADAIAAIKDAQRLKAGSR